MPHFQLLKISGLLIVAGLLTAKALAQPQTKVTSADKSASIAQEKNVPAKPGTNASDYVGAEVCKTCHEDIYNNWEKTPHWKTTLDTKGGPSRQGCEGCHGPGLA